MHGYIIVYLYDDNSIMFALLLEMLYFLIIRKSESQHMQCSKCACAI